MKRRHPGAVVMGLGFSGVGAIHSLAEMNPRPDPIIGLDHNPKELGFASRSGHMLLAPPPWADEGRVLRDFIVDLTRRFETRLVLYPCGDDYVRFLSTHRESLAESCLFLLPEAGSLEILMNKARFADHARSLGVASPACAVVRSEPGLVLAEGMRWPIVAKSLTSLKDDPFWGILRVKQFDTVREWNDFFTAFAGSGHEVMIQEFIPGGDREQFVYEGLWSPEGKELLGFTVQKVRQQPTGFGSSCRATARLVPEVLEAGRKLLAAIGYRGLADVDFKRDARDGRFWAMEVNPRLGGVHRSGRSCGIELVWDQYRMLAGETITPRVQPAGVKGEWGHVSKDLRGLLPQLPKHPGLIGPWIASYLSLPMDALFTWRDPGPYRASMGRLTRAVFRELFAGRALRRADGGVGAGASAAARRVPAPDEDQDAFR
jgi:predicted ATP-grasp superfamily ATP-dependent carboligase